MGICCMAQETQTGALYQPRGVGLGGKCEGGSKGRGYMCTCGWFLLRFDRKQQNSVKQLFFNNKKIDFFLKRTEIIIIKRTKIIIIKRTENWHQTPLKGAMLLLLSHFSHVWLWPHGLQPGTRLLCPWDTKVGCQCLLPKGSYKNDKHINKMTLSIMSY